MLDHSIERAHAHLDAVARRRVAHLDGPTAADWEHCRAGVGRLAEPFRQLLSRGGNLGHVSSHHHFPSIASPVGTAMTSPLRLGTGKTLPRVMIPLPAKTAVFHRNPSTTSALH